MKSPESIMVIAGEASGDMHAAMVIKALRRKAPKLKIFGMGGPLMAKAGMEVREDLTERAIMGFVKVAANLPTIWGRFRKCDQWLSEEKPDLLFLVDYPGFNLRLAEKAHKLGIPVGYYVAPQVWAWHESRIPAMKKFISKLLCILPFEKAFFRKKGMETIYVGHPLIEEMDLKRVKRDPVLRKNGIPPSGFPLVCAMPGSRKGEIEKIWPYYLEASRLLRRTYPDAAFIVPKPHGLVPEDYPGLRPEDPIFFLEAPAYDPRKVCDLAWVKSGTGTLETALLGIPMVVSYKVAAVEGFLAKRLLKIKDVSLVNILAGKTVVPELLQEGATPERLVAETNRLLDDHRARAGQLKEFGKIRKDLEKPPKASENVAREILQMLQGGG